MTERKTVDQLIPGDMIDLEGIDISDANEQVWLFEYATVDEVRASLADGLTIIYTENGAVPAVVPADATFKVLGNDGEPFTGPDSPFTASGSSEPGWAERSVQS